MRPSASQVRSDLEAARAGEDFPARSSELADQWIAAGAGLDVAEAVFRFIEANPELEYGMPGALVQFAERFHRRGYEPLLLASVRRHPTRVTTWMLNRLLNGTREPAVRADYLDAMRGISVSPLADAETRDEALHFLTRPA
jgi:hypothetical protein